ncbi:MAG: hypothetical protein Q9159_006774 [Coniocarpon cinnabarinum]
MSHRALPIEILDNIIDLYLGRYLQKLMNERPSSLNKYKHRKFPTEADQKVLIHRIRWRNRKLIKDLMALTSVSRAVMATVQHRMSIYRFEAVKTFCRLFNEEDPARVKDDCKRPVVLFRNANNQCCVEHMHKNWAVKKYEVALKTLFTLGRSIADILGTKRPDLEELLYQIRCVNKSKTRIKINRSKFHLRDAMIFPNELWHHIIKHRIRADLVALLSEDISVELGHSNKEYVKAELRMAEARQNFRRHVLSHSLRSLALVCTAFMDIIHSLSKFACEYGIRHFWCGPLNHCLTRCDGFHYLFAKRDYGLPAFWLQRRLYVRRNEFPLEVMLTIGRLTADLMGKRRPPIEKLIRRIEAHNRICNVKVELDFRWALKWMGVRTLITK